MQGLTKDQGLLLLAFISVVIYGMLPGLLSAKEEVTPEEEIKYILKGIYWLIWFITLKILGG